MKGLHALTLSDKMIDASELLASRAETETSRQFQCETFHIGQEIIDHVEPSAQESSDRAHLFVFEDNASVKKKKIFGVREAAHSSCFSDASCELELACCKNRI